MPFKSLIQWFDRQEVTLPDIQEQQPNYYKAIMKEIKEMENQYLDAEEEKAKEHEVKAKGYFKGAQRKILEGVNHG